MQGTSKQSRPLLIQKNLKIMINKLISNELSKRSLPLPTMVNKSKYNVSSSLTSRKNNVNGSNNKTNKKKHSTSVNNNKKNKQKSANSLNHNNTSNSSNSYNNNNNNNNNNGIQIFNRNQFIEKLSSFKSVQNSYLMSQINQHQQKQQQNHKLSDNQINKRIIIKTDQSIECIQQIHNYQKNIYKELFFNNNINNNNNSNNSNSNNNNHNNNAQINENKNSKQTQYLIQTYIKLLSQQQNNNNIEQNYINQNNRQYQYQYDQNDYNNQQQRLQQQQNHLKLSDINQLQSIMGVHQKQLLNYKNNSKVNQKTSICYMEKQEEVDLVDSRIKEYIKNSNNNENKEKNEYKKQQKLLYESINKNKVNSNEQSKQLKNPQYNDNIQQNSNNHINTNPNPSLPSTTQFRPFISSQMGIESIKKSSNSKQNQQQISLIQQQQQKNKLNQLKKQQIQKWGYLLEFIKDNMNKETNTQTVLETVYKYLEKAKIDLIKESNINHINNANHINHINNINNNNLINNINNNNNQNNHQNNCLSLNNNNNNKSRQLQQFTNRLSSQYEKSSRQLFNDDSNQYYNQKQDKIKSYNSENSKQIQNYLQNNSHQNQNQDDNQDQQYYDTEEQYDQQNESQQSHQQSQQQQQNDQQQRNNHLADQQVLSFKQDYSNQSDQQLKYMNLQTIDSALKTRYNSLTQRKIRQLQHLQSLYEQKKLTSQQYEQQKQKINKLIKKQTNQILKVKKNIWKGYNQAKGILDKNYIFNEKQNNQKKMMKCLSQSYLMKKNGKYGVNLNLNDNSNYQIEYNRRIKNDRIKQIRGKQREKLKSQQQQQLTQTIKLKSKQSEQQQQQQQQEQQQYTQSQQNEQQQYEQEQSIQKARLLKQVQKQRLQIQQISKNKNKLQQFQQKSQSSKYNQQSSKYNSQQSQQSQQQHDQSQKQQQQQPQILTQTLIHSGTDNQFSISQEHQRQLYFNQNNNSKINSKNNNNNNSKKLSPSSLQQQQQKSNPMSPSSIHYQQLDKEINSSDDQINYYDNFGQEFNTNRQGKNDVYSSSQSSQQNDQQKQIINDQLQLINLQKQFPSTKKSTKPSTRPSKSPKPTEQQLLNLQRLKYITQQDKQDIFQFLFLDLCIQLYQQPCKDNKIMNSINKHVQRMYQMSKRKKGVKTNLNVVKDYLKRFCGYIIRTNKKILDNLHVPMGPTAIEMLKYMHENDQMDEEQPINDTQQQVVTLIIPIQSFDIFQRSLLPTLQFQKYYQDQQKQSQRVHFLKNILHIHNKALFDALNEFLDQQRPYGIWGKPFPWKKSSSFSHKFNQIQLQQKFKKAAQKVVQACSYVCGLLIDKQQSLVSNAKVSQVYIEQIRQDRISRMLANDMIENQQRWVFYDDQQTEVLVQAGNYIYQKLLVQCMQEMLFIKNRELVEV